MTFAAAVEAVKRQYIDLTRREIGVVRLKRENGEAGVVEITDTRTLSVDAPVLYVSKIHLRSSRGVGKQNNKDKVWRSLPGGTYPYNNVDPPGLAQRCAELFVYDEEG